MEKKVRLGYWRTSQQPEESGKGCFCIWNFWIDFMQIRYWERIVGFEPDLYCFIYDLIGFMPNMSEELKLILYWSVPHIVLRSYSHPKFYVLCSKSLWLWQISPSLDQFYPKPNVLSPYWISQGRIFLLNLRFPERAL